MPPITTPNTLHKEVSKGSKAWVQYLHLDREVLNPSPCEQHMDTDINSHAYETVMESYPNNCFEQSLHNAKRPVSLVILILKGGVISADVKLRMLLVHLFLGNSFNNPIEHVM